MTADQPDKEQKDYAGEVFRLKTWTDYRQKLPRPAPGQVQMLSEGFKTRPGMHTVMVRIGAIDETQALTEEWVISAMRAIGWESVKPPEGQTK